MEFDRVYSVYKSFRDMLSSTAIPIPFLRASRLSEPPKLDAFEA